MFKMMKTTQKKNRVHEQVNTREGDDMISCRQEGDEDGSGCCR